ncbi:hypothetical protein KSP40_PGU021228 [Platanthera guangdongensis]|uniref:Reverse transcriptase n=1 Tax=Platanthera guangdongensis TaxID=2320717 RepID=A0ABR2MMM4_9ASPA
MIFNTYDYLGVKLAMRKLTKSDFATTLIKWQTRIRQWGNRHLSLAGRVALIRFSFLAGPVFLLTHSAIHRAILDEVEQLCNIPFPTRPLSVVFGHD